MSDKLVRALGRWDLTAIAINTIIGTGIFILPARAAGLIGSYSIFGIIACSLVIALIVLCFAEVSSRFESTGGMYLYAREAFGPIVGFEVGWLYWVVRVATFAANCNAFLIYLGYFFPEATSGAIRILIICAIIASITTVNVLGVRESALITNIFTIGKIVPLVLFVGVGLFFVDPANFNFEQVPEYGRFSEAVLLLIYAYVGFEGAVIPAGESREPRKHLPFALLAALAFCTVLFVLVQLVAIGTLPNLAAAERPLTEAAGSFLGAFGSTFIAVGALVSILGNLNGGFLGATRLPFAMAEQRELPSALSHIHSRFQTPVFSILITALAILVLTIQSSFFTAVTIATVTRLLVYATTCVALPVFRRRPGRVEDAYFKVPLGLFVAALSVALIVWLLTDKKVIAEGLPILITAAVGVAIYFAYRLFGKDGVNVGS